MLSTTIQLTVALGVCGLAAGAGAQTYSVADLGTAGGPLASGFGINAAGHAVGASTAPDAHYSGLYAGPGGPAAIPPLSGDLECWAFGVDTAEEVATMSFKLGDLATHGQRWQNGVITNLGNFAPRAISNNGIMAGFVSISSATLGQVDHAAMWRGAAMTDLGTLGGSHSYAAGINGFAQAVGWSYTSGDASIRATLWQAGPTMVELGTLGGVNSQAYAISNNRGVVGVSDTPAGVPHAFFAVVDSAGALVMRMDLGALPGSGGVSYAYGLNNSADIVGTSGSRAFLWRNGVMSDLNGAIPAGSGWVLERAWAISDSATIVGAGLYRGVPRGFVLIPACYANCDGSAAVPILNVNDFICFQQRFAAGDTYANCDGSTLAPVLNVNDFVCFQTLFARGCP